MWEYIIKSWTKHTKLSAKTLDAFYKTRLWQKCRGATLERDEYLCQICLGDDDPIPADTVHHIIHLRDDPSRALDDNNLMSVCFDCHNDLHPEKGFGKKSEKIIPEEINTFDVNNNPEIFW